MTDREGKPAPETRNKLALFLINIENDRVARAARGRAPLAGGLAVSQPPVHLDITLMLAANFDTPLYLDGVRVLSAAMAVLQAQPVMTPQTVPDMPSGLQQLSFEITNIKTDTLGQLWGNLGGRYLPSVCYLMRSVAIDGAAVDRLEAPIAGLATATAAEAAS